MEENTLIPLFGKTTREAIAVGVVRGIIFEVKGYMRTLAEQGTPFVTFVTGGNAPYILGSLQEEAQFEPHLVLIGLNCILEYNKVEHNEI